MNKVEQIKASVIIPFHSFSGGDDAAQASPSAGVKQLQPATTQQHLNQPTTQLEEVILVDNDNYDGTQDPTADGH